MNCPAPQEHSAAGISASKIRLMSETMANEPPPGRRWRSGPANFGERAHLARGGEKTIAAAAPAQLIVALQF
ncbi:MAG: hypothetical protein ACLR9W_04180 [Enterobacter hormaechei]